LAQAPLQGLAITFCGEIAQLCSDKEIFCVSMLFRRKVADPSRPLEHADFKSSKKVDRSGEQAHFRLFLEKKICSWSEGSSHLKRLKMPIRSVRSSCVMSKLIQGSIHCAAIPRFENLANQIMPPEAK
jgi:hypothetical protein